MPDVNWIGVLLSMVAVFVIGGPWYNLFFKKAWQRAAGVTPETAQHGHPAKVFGGAAVAGLIGAFVVAMFVPQALELHDAVAVGFHIGLAVTAGFAINYLFANRSLVLLAIDGGYNLVLFTAMGAIFGLVG